MMKHRSGGLDTTLTRASLPCGILLMPYGMTHTTETNSFAVFAGSTLAVTGIMLLGSLWEPSTRVKGVRPRHGRRRMGYFDLR
jgi:hypothetical protein